MVATFELFYNAYMAVLIGITAVGSSRHGQQLRTTAVRSLRATELAQPESRTCAPITHRASPHADHIPGALMAFTVAGGNGWLDDPDRAPADMAVSAAGRLSAQRDGTEGQRETNKRQRQAERQTEGQRQTRKRHTVYA